MKILWIRFCCLLGRHRSTHLHQRPIGFDPRYSVTVLRCSHCLRELPAGAAQEKTE